VLVDQLLTQKVERLTCVPGESYLAVLDALHDPADPCPAGTNLAESPRVNDASSEEQQRHMRWHVMQ